MPTEKGDCGSGSSQSAMRLRSLLFYSTEPIDPARANQQKRSFNWQKVRSQPLVVSTAQLTPIGIQRLAEALLRTF